MATKYYLIVVGGTVVAKRAHGDIAAAPTNSIRVSKTTFDTVGPGWQQAGGAGGFVPPVTPDRPDTDRERLTRLEARLKILEARVTALES